MGRELGRAVWEELIGQLVAQKRRLVEFEEYETDSRPNPGASEEQLRAVEDRLGYSLDPQYRELLSVADGWHHFFITYSLLGTDDIGVGPRWETGVELAEMWFDDRWADDVGAANDPTQYQLVVENDNDYSGNVYLFVGQARAMATGTAVPLPNDESRHQDLYSYFLAELDMMTTFADRATLGRHSEPWWGRNLRTDPPSIGEIVAKIGELMAIGDPGAAPALRAGATDAELDELDRHLGGGLHPAHRELLRASNGLSTPIFYCVGDVLSTREIIGGARWRDMLVDRQVYEDRQHEAQVSNHRAAGLPEPETPAPVAERVTSISATPFAVSGDRPYGIGTSDGLVRDLLTACADPDGLDRSAEGTVRDYLLHACSRLWWHVGQPAGNPGCP